MRASLGSASVTWSRLFSRAGSLLRMRGAMVALTRKMLDGWNDGEVFDIHPEMMGLTLRIVGKTLFDSEMERDIRDIDHAMNDLLVEVASHWKRPVFVPDAIPLPGHLRYRRAIRTIERVVSSMIAERRASGLENRIDCLSRLMAARDEASRPMSDTLLRDEVMTLLLAGHETTALALSWTSFLLGQHPDAEARIAAEIAEVLGDRPATVDDIPRLKFTESVVMEAMRLYPPAWAIGRESTQPVKLGGHSFPEGTTILISPWVLHRDPRYFSKPETFRPERWMGNLARELPRFAYTRRPAHLHRPALRNAGSNSGGDDHGATLLYRMPARSDREAVSVDHLAPRRRRMGQDQGTSDTPMMSQPRGAQN